MLLGALLALLATRAAHAQTDEAAVEALSKANKLGLENYENLGFAEARKILSNAIEQAERAGLQKHPLLAQAHVLMGIAFLADKQNDEAIASFRRALAIQPGVKIPERVANPEIQEVFAEAVKAGPSDAGGATAGGTTPKAEEKAEAKEDGEDAEDVAKKKAVDHAAKVSPPDGAAEKGEETEEEEEESPGAQTWFLGLGLGSGFGWVSGDAEVNSGVKISGVHPASLVHVSPEVGYFLSPTLLLSVQLRIQFMSGATSKLDTNLLGCGSDHVCQPAKGAFAGLAKLAWFLDQGSLRPYVAGLLGVGQLRHKATLSGYNDCGSDPAKPVACVDTVVSGPLLLGGGAGAVFQLADSFALTAGLNALIGAPKATVNFDFNGGVAVEF